MFARMNEIKDIFLSRAKHYYLLVGLTLVALLMVSRFAPIFSLPVLILFVILYAVFSTLGSMYLTVIYRRHRQFKLAPGGKLSKWNRRWLATFIIVFVVALASGLVFVLSSPSWEIKEWLIVILSAFLFYPIYCVFLSWSKRQYRIGFEQSSAMFWGCLLLCLVMSVGFGVLFSSPQQGDGSFAFAYQARAAVFQNSPSALFSDVGKLYALSSSLGSYGIAQITDLLPVAYFVFLIASLVMTIFGLLGVFCVCILSKDEIKLEFKLLQNDPSEESHEPVLKRYVVALIAVSVAFTCGAVYSNSKLIEIKDSGVSTYIDSFVSKEVAEISYTFDVLIKGAQETTELVNNYDEESKLLREKMNNELKPLINDYYNQCRNNLDFYINSLEQERKEQMNIIEIIRRIDSAYALKSDEEYFVSVISTHSNKGTIENQYSDLHSQLVNLKRTLQEKFELNSTSIGSPQLFSWSYNLGRQNSLDLWLPFTNSEDDQIVKDAFQNDLIDADREKLKFALQRLIDKAEEETYSAFEKEISCFEKPDLVQVF